MVFQFFPTAAICGDDYTASAHKMRFCRQRCTDPPPEIDAKLGSLGKLHSLFSNVKFSLRSGKC